MIVVFVKELKHFLHKKYKAIKYIPEFLALEQKNFNLINAIFSVCTGVPVSGPVYR